MDIDRYPTLGKRIKVTTPEDVLEAVRAVWPNAIQHGSTGYERSWQCETELGLRLVAHSWSPKRLMDWFWVRIALDLESTEPW